jgi:hypothetical protein
MADACIALLSDFGSQGAYAGVMKGVIAKRAPGTQLIDITHEIPPGDIRQAAFRLWQALPYFPEKTVFLAVVDPGVGTSRKPVAIRGEGFFCVGPDNGIFTYMLEGRGPATAVQIRIDEPGSNTFHGRDVFAPAAALLAAGADVARLGPPVEGLLSLAWPRLSISKRRDAIIGEMMCPDRFGNMVTSIGALTRIGDLLRLQPWTPGCESCEFPASKARVVTGHGQRLPVRQTFADVPVGKALAYIGSDNLLEIGVNQGSVADAFGLIPGAEISLAWG